MTSKNSFFNKTWYKNLLKRFWIVGLGAAVAYVFLYLYPILQGGYTEAYQFYATYLKGTYFIGNMTISVIALLASVALFYYLHNKNASITIHALPIKKSELYWTSLVAGFTLIFLPLIFTTCVLIFFGKTIPLYGKLLTIKNCLGWFLIQSALILFVYGITQLCGVITGNIYTHCILGTFFNLLPWIGTQFFTILKGTFTYGLEEPALTLSNYSTAFSYVYTLDRWIDFQDVGYLFTYILIGVFFIFISYFIYKSVKLEYIGSSVVFNHLRDIVVIISTLVISSFISYLFVFDQTSLSTMRISFVIIGIIVSFVVFAASRMIAESTIYILNKSTLKKFIGYVVIFGLISAFTVFDISNIEGKTPNKDDISYVSFNSDYSAFYNVKLNDSETINMIYNIHRDIIKAPHNANNSAHYFNITYHLVNGEKLTRNYNISNAIFNKYIKKDMQKLYQNETYIDHLFKNQDWKEVSIYNSHDDSGNSIVYISDNDYKALKYCLKKDYKSITLDDLTDALTDSKYSIDVYNDKDELFSFYFNKKFKNTVQFLNARGYSKKFSKWTL